MAPKREKVHFDDEIFLVDDTYTYRGTPIGSNKRREISLKIKKGAAQKDVLRAKAVAVSDLEKIGHKMGKNSFVNISKEYLDYRAEEANSPRGISKATLYETTSILELHFQPFFGHARIDEIDQSKFNDYCRLKKRAELNLVNHRKVINHFLSWCVSEGYLRMRPELKLPKWAQRDRRRRVILTDDDIRRLLAAAVKAEHSSVLLYIMMYLFMGMRNMEICQLRWDEVDLEKAALQVNPMSNRKRKSRALPINPFVLSKLREVKVNAKTEWVFPSRTKGGRYPHLNPQGGIRVPWFRVLDEAGLTNKITPHDLRATFETFMHTNVQFTDTQREKMAGAAIDVQKNIYVSMDVDRLRGLENSVQVSGLERILGGKTGGMTPIKKASRLASSRQKGRISK